ncbi:MAG: hypothetical protein K2L51_01215 [Clostridiales bacterium]|nr:hypothetical protein [Clostridiales bacterium]
MKIYDEENTAFDDDLDEMAGYTVNDEHSIFKKFAPEPETQTVATPLPQNEQTVIMVEPNVARLRDGQELALAFTEEGCNVLCADKKVGGLKAAYASKLRAERGGQCARVYYKQTVPPMVRIVFGEGEKIPQ